MNLQTRSFNKAYQSYYNKLRSVSHQGISILEIGGGAHPSIPNRSQFKYTIIDPDQRELDKAPNDVIKIHSAVENWQTDQKYDLIISKMVLEHVEDPDAFHLAVTDKLATGGKVIHFFACRHSIPAAVNRYLPERVGDYILKLLKNRDLADSPKYKAYYRRTKGHTRDQLEYFESLGYQIEEYDSFVGHKYFENVPVIKLLERMYTKLLYRMQIKSLATVAMVKMKLPS